MLIEKLFQSIENSLSFDHGKSRLKAFAIPYISQCSNLPHSSSFLHLLALYLCMCVSLFICICYLKLVNATVAGNVYVQVVVAVCWNSKCCKQLHEQVTHFECH